MNRQVIAAGTGIGFRIGQSGDLAAFSIDGSERLSSVRTFDYCGKIYVSTGDVLWSDRSNPLLTIVTDQVGRHDLLYAPCSLEMYRKQYGVSGYHANCHDNLCSALREAGVQPEPLVSTLNFFMDASVAPDGTLSFAPPRSRAGDSMVLRAEMDLVIALSACPTSTCNGGAAPKPLAFEVA
jgi:uncharacterized protein YcgI (DUF1989 family)